MAITDQNVKLYQAQTLDDTENGGGRMSGVEVIDGELNNLFDDIAGLDRVYGRVSLRKGFLSVRTEDTEKYQGAHAIISTAPEDDRVSVALFTTGSTSDRRIAARDRVERYVVAGPRTSYTLYDNHLAGSRALLVYANPEDPIPEAGEVLCLSIESAGHPNNGTQQFVRTLGVTHTIRDFGDYQKRIITLTLSAPLQIDFPGADVAFVQPASATRIRSTSIADGSNYYSIKPLAVAISEGALTLKVDNILAPVVPSAQRETPVLDAVLGVEALTGVPAGAAISHNHGSKNLVGGAFLVTAERGILRRSLTVVYNGSETLSDNGNGLLTRTAGTPASIDATGTVDYATGAINVSGTGASGTVANVTLSYQPAAYPAQTQHTQGEAITLINTGLVRVATLVPPPAPGTLTVAYRALGRWYALRDNGAGQLVGDEGTGTGNVNYGTGSLTITVGFAPDVGSHVLYAWGTDAHFEPIATGSGYELGAVEFALPLDVVSGVSKVITAGSVVLSYTAGAAAQELTDDGTGLLTGDGTGTVDYATGAVRFLPDVLPGTSAVIAAEYIQRDVVVQPDPDNTEFDVVGESVVHTSAETPIDPGVTIEAFYADPTGLLYEVSYVQDGAAFRRTALGPTVGLTTSEGYRFDGLTGHNISGLFGEFDGGAGLIRLPRTIPNIRAKLSYYVPPGTNSSTIAVGEKVYSNALATSYHGNYQTIETVRPGYWQSFEKTAPVTLTFSHAIARYTAETALPPAPSTYNHTLTSLGVAFLSDTPKGLTTGSMLFSLNGRRYYDVSGTLKYRDNNDMPVSAGSVDYASGIANLSSWVGGGARVATVQALLTRYGNWPLKEVIWRVPGAPVREGSLSGVATEFQQDPAAFASQTNGTITGSNVTSGSLNPVTGVYQVVFTEAVNPDTARYSAVVLAFLPLDPVILGLDPTRLPVDGRVPVFRPGNVLVIHHTATTALPDPVAPTVDYEVGRERISYAIVRDAEGVRVPTDKYTSNLTDGSVQFIAPLDLSDYVQPLVVEHRIEDSVLCSEAQLSGDLSLVGLITHDFPLGSFVSSALLFGDLQARIYNLFEQQAWTGVWSNALLGNASTGQYNEAAFPLEIVNTGAITERWRIEYTGPNTFRLIGETLGPVAEGRNDIDFAPENPATLTPYFVIRADGWSAGWVSGNQVRFNTDGATAPIWFLRCTLQGPVQEPNDNVRVQLRGSARRVTP